MKECIICGGRTEHPIRAALHHFRLVEWGQWRYWRGNISMFGFWYGLRGCLTLSFPILNTLIHWRHRKCTLELPGGVPLESAFDKRGCALKSSERREAK